MSKSFYSSYGKALFELIGDDKNKIIAYQNELKKVNSDLENNSDLASFLSSYSIPKEKQYYVIDKLYANKNYEHLAPFLKVIANKHLFTKFDIILNSFNEIANKYLGKKEGIVYSAKKISDSELKTLENILSKKLNNEVVLSRRVEPSLLGGIRVFIDGKVYDGSLSTKIENLRKELLKTAKGSNDL